MDNLEDRIGIDAIKRIQLLRRNIRTMLKTDRICKIISPAIEKEFGFPVIIGSRREREHWWNVFPDGAILDASADQFGEDSICVVPTSSLTHSEYVK